MKTEYYNLEELSLKKNFNEEIILIIPVGFNHCPILPRIINDKIPNITKFYSNVVTNSIAMGVNPTVVTAHHEEKKFIIALLFCVDKFLLQDKFFELLIELNRRIPEKKIIFHATLLKEFVFNIELFEFDLGFFANKQNLRAMFYYNTEEII